MNNLAGHYVDELLNYFKLSYKKLVSTNVNISYEEVALHCAQSIGLVKSIDFPDLLFWFNNIHHQYFLKPLIEGTSHNEIVMHGHEVAMITNQGERHQLSINSITPEDFQLSLEILALKNRQDWNYNSPFVSFHCSLFGEKYRVSLLHPSCGIRSQSKLFARRIFHLSPSLKLFELNPHLELSIKEMILHKKNILVSGGTGSGKTTFIRSLISEVSPIEHLVIMEDTHEITLSLPQSTLLLSSDKTQSHSLTQACAYALRMSPDRLILGEMRSHEVIPFMLAMNTGHKGLMSTIHANSAIDAISRVALLFSLFSEKQDISFSTIVKLICKSVDIIIHLENRKVKEIAKILGSDGDRPLYENLYSL